MKQNQVKCVTSTERIFFDENVKTFRLYAGNSLYAISISPELTLEHLYWGKTLHPGYDLRYLNQSSRPTHFSTLEAAPDYLEASLMPCDTLADIQRAWKESKSGKKSIDSMEAFHKRRLENYTWRVLSKKTQESIHNQLSLEDLTTDVNGMDSTLSSPGGQEMLPDSSVLTSPRNAPLSLPLSRRRSSSNPGGLAGIAASPSLANLHSAEVLTRTPWDERNNPQAVDYVPESFSAINRPSSISLASLNAAATSGVTPQLSPMHRNVSHSYGMSHAFERDEGIIGKGSLCVEYGDHGTGDFRTPSFVVVDNFNGSTISPLKYRKHTIYCGKLPMPDDQPSIRCYKMKQASTLVITMADIGSGLEVDFIYVAMHDYDAITRRVEFRNEDHRIRTSENRPVSPPQTQPLAQNSNSKVIQKACSSTIDFESPSLPFHLVQLSGSWGRERSVVETKLAHGMQGFGSTRGVSGHQQNPFAVVTVGTPNETHGEVKAFSLIYSGNFLVEAELNETGRLRLNIGLNPSGLQWHLKQGKSFSTPEAVLVRSGEGLGGMSRMMHRLYLDHLIPRSWADKEPPVLLNTWEAKYFNVNHNNVVEMARQAVKLGINLVVLDDGWFGNRNNDMTSLGDWVADPVKFPQGIDGLAQELNDLGCKFGLWFEPEMMSEDSKLFGLHPEWYLHVPGRPRQMGRNQMVLDLSRREVRDYLFNEMSAILRSANVEYIKWDMNRPLTEVHSTATRTVEGEEVWQAEISHRYVLGLYELQNRITKTFPHILLENCASGGGRFDPGMLYYSPQIWCSDNTDALVRMKIQYGTSLAYPTRCVGAHVSSVPNHITGNTTRLRTRGFVAMCGTMGYELDISTVSLSERALFIKHIELFRQVAPVIWWGDLYRLWDPFKMNLCAWMYVSRDQSQAVVFAFSMNSDHWSNLVPRLQLQGLLPDVEYEVNEPVPNNVAQNTGNLMIIETEAPVYQLGVNSVCFTGEILMNAGLPVKFYTLDDSIVFTLHRVGSVASMSGGGGSYSNTLSAMQKYNNPSHAFF